MPFPTPFRAEGFAIFLLAASTAFGQSVSTNVFAVRAEQAFTRAQKDYADHPESSTNAWQLGRTTYDWAEFATNSDQRAAVAQVGIAACEKLVARETNSAIGHYYLGMDYGELTEAEAPSLAAYRMIRNIEREFKTATDLDRTVDYAGPLRCLGLLYRDAPGWPLSIGSKRKALDYLQQAVAAAPNYPENQINLLESYISWGDEVEAQGAWRRLNILWPGAQTNFTGQAWEPSWQDWNSRRAAAKREFQRVFKEPLLP